MQLTWTSTKAFPHSQIKLGMMQRIKLRFQGLRSVLALLNLHCPTRNISITASKLLLCIPKLLLRVTIGQQVNDGNALNLNTGSFLDDSHFYCSSDEPEQAATQICKSWQRSLQFDDIMGLVTNSNKSFFFSNSTHVIALVNSEMSRLPSKNQLTRKDSFTLVGSVVTSLGQPDTHNRNQRVFTTVEKLQKLRYAPLRFDFRIRLAGAIFKAAIFGSELVELTHGLLESLRSGIVATLWRGKSWLRCWATTATHIVPVHILHPYAASMYHTLTLVSRLLRRREDLRAVFEHHYQTCRSMRRRTACSFGPNIPFTGCHQMFSIPISHIGWFVARSFRSKCESPPS